MTQVRKSATMTPTQSRRRSISRGFTALLGAAFILVFAASLCAQVVSDPRTAEFDPSADHWVLLDGGEPAVLGYELQVYVLGASAPFTTVDMGKPSPDADGKIRYDFASVVAGWPLPGGDYEARVRAIGPEGSALSELSNAFSFASSGACTFSLSSSSAQIGAAGDNYGVGVSTGEGCQWTATTTLSWVTLWTAGGSGGGTAAFEVKANVSSTSRTGTITIGGETLTIRQDAAAPASGAFVGPFDGGGWTGKIRDGHLLYNDVPYPITGAMVTLPDCRQYLVAPNGRLFGGTPVVGCVPGGGGGGSPATPTIAWAMPAAITQGTALGAAQLNATAASGGSALAGTFVYTPAAGTVMNTVGTQTLRVSFTPANATIYTSASATVTIQVNATGGGGAFVGPFDGGGWTGKIQDGQLLYNGAPYPITNGTVTLPDCRQYLVAPNGRLFGGTLVAACQQDGGATAGGGGTAGVDETAGGGGAFAGPFNGGSWNGVIEKGKLIYNGVPYPIANGRVTLPDCRMYIVAPNGALIGGVLVEGCNAQ